MNLKSKIVLIRANSVRSDTRTIKMYQTLNKIGPFEAILWNRDTVRETSPKAHRLYLNVPLGSKKIFIFFPIWAAFCLWQLNKIKPDIIHGCDLEGIVPAYLYSLIRKVKIIYDIHDVSAGKYNLHAKSKMKTIFLKLDRFFIHKSDAFLIPDPGRINQLEMTFQDFAKVKFKCHVVYNSDLITKGKKIVSLKNKKITAVYIGNMTRDIRGLEFILDAIKIHPEITFQVAGMGADLDYFTKKFKSLNASNAKFFGRVDHNKAMKLNSKADIMISLLNPKFNNYKYASSTKLFEAFRLFKPIIVSKKTATSEILASAKWGVAIDYKSGELEKTLSKILSGEITFILDSNRVQQFDWQKMESKIVGLYASFIDL